MSDYVTNSCGSCGGKPILMFDGREYNITCQHCKYQSQSSHEERDAVANWNFSSYIRAEDIKPKASCDGDCACKAKKDSIKDCKPDYSLLPKSFMDAVSFAMMSGMIKYSRNQYLKGHTLSDLTAATVRHIKEFESGSDIDADCTERMFNTYGDIAPEVTHLACAAANILMLIEEMRIGTLNDNREI